MTFLVIPTVNKNYEVQHDRDIKVALTREAALFQRFINNQQTILKDFASYPNMTNAVMLSDASNTGLIELMENAVIGGNKGKLVLQDIEGNILIQTSRDMQGIYNSKSSRWLTSILDGSSTRYFGLLNQEGDHFAFQISVPVTYNGYVEGVLSAELNFPFNSVFISEPSQKTAFKLRQGTVSISSNTDHINIVRENSIKLEDDDITFTFITDDTPIREAAYKSRNTILLVLISGLLLSLLLFILLSYSGLAEFSRGSSTLIVKRYGISITVCLLGFAVSVAAYNIIVNLQRESLEKEFIADSKASVQGIREELNRNLIVLDAVKAFYNASDRVDRKEFGTFVTPLLESHKNIQAVEWIPYVSTELRKNYEQLAEHEGFKGYEIRERNANGEMVSAGVRDFYFPVFYVEPFSGNEKALGFDLASNSERFSALVKSRDTEKKAATRPITLVQEKESQVGILVFHSIFRRNIDRNESDQNSKLSGLVLLIFRVESLVNGVLDERNKDISFYITDITDNASSVDIYGKEVTSPEFFYSEKFEIAGRRWSVVASVENPAFPMRWLAWLILVVGLVFSLLITLGLTHLIRRREIVEALVELRTAELRMISSTVANANDIFIITKADEINAEKNGPRIVYVNDAFTRLTGYSADEAIDETPRILQGENTQREELEKINRALAKGDGYSGELINYTKDGNEFWIELNIFPIKDDEGKTTHFAAVEREITERKRSQAEREKLIETLISSNEELERFAFVCSHDLQEPLRMIRSFSEKLQGHIASDLEDDEKGKKYFRFITEGAERAQNLIADILTYSSISNDTQALQSVDIEEFIANINETMTSSHEDSAGKVTYDSLPILHGNQTQLYQLFQNLINNGLKYQRPDAKPHVHIGVKDDGEFWQFFVQDNGIGMEARHLKKIFDVFQRLHRKSQFAGTGVGLSICKKVVERHGGVLWVESEVGKGSTFYFTLLKPHLLEAVNE